MNYYRLNAPDVSAELFDNEILAINLTSGVYHSLRFSAVPFWLMLEDGISVETAITELANLYHTDTALLHENFTILLNSLLENHLILPCKQPEAPATRDYTQFSRDIYENPVLESYADMKDLLLLDPIHEVDKTGWPNKPTDKN